MTDWAYVTHPDLDNAGAKIPNDPIVINSYKIRGWVLKDLPGELDPESGNGPGPGEDQKKPEEEINGPGLKEQARHLPEPETVNGPGLQDQLPEDDHPEINGPAGVAVLMQAQRDQEEAEKELSRSKRSRKKETQPPSGKDHEGDES